MFCAQSLIINAAGMRFIFLVFYYKHFSLFVGFHSTILMNGVKEYFLLFRVFSALRSSARFRNWKRKAEWNLKRIKQMRKKKVKIKIKLCIYIVGGSCSVKKNSEVSSIFYINVSVCRLPCLLCSRFRVKSRHFFSSLSLLTGIFFSRGKGT